MGRVNAPGAKSANEIDDTKINKYADDSTNNIVVLCIHIVGASCVFNAAIPGLDV